MIRSRNVAYEVESLLEGPRPPPSTKQPTTATAATGSTGSLNVRLGGKKKATPPNPPMVRQESVYGTAGPGTFVPMKVSAIDLYRHQFACARHF